MTHFRALFGGHQPPNKEMIIQETTNVAVVDEVL
jgi:hypothetical protein